MRLRYTLPALTDLEGILGHVADQSPSGGRKVAKRIKMITDLLRHPEVGRLTEFTNNKIVIHAVRHGARDPASMPGSGGS